MKKYSWGYIREMTSEEYKHFNIMNKNLPGKKEKLVYRYGKYSTNGIVLIEGISWTPYGFFRRVKGGFIYAGYESYVKYCIDGTVLYDVEDK